MNFKKLFLTMALLAIVVGVAQSATKVYYLVGVYNVYKCDYPDPFEQERQQIEEDYSDAIANAQTRYQARVNNIKDLELPYDEEDVLIVKAKAKLDLATDQAAMDREDALSEYYEVDFTIRDNHPEFVIEDGLACQIVCVEYNASRVFLYFTFFEPWYGYIGRTPYGWGYRQRYHYDDYRVKYRDFRDRGSIRYREPRVWRDRWNERRPERRNDYKPVRRLERQREDPKGWRTNSINRRPDTNNRSNQKPGLNERPKSSGGDDNSPNDRRGSINSKPSSPNSREMGRKPGTVERPKGRDDKPEVNQPERIDRDNKSSETRETKKSGEPRVRTQPTEPTQPREPRETTRVRTQPTEPTQPRETPRSDENRSRTRDTNVNNDRPQRPSRDSKPVEPKREERKRVEPSKDSNKSSDSNKSKDDKTKDEKKDRKRGR